MRRMVKAYMLCVMVNLSMKVSLGMINLMERVGCNMKMVIVMRVSLERV